MKIIVTAVSPSIESDVDTRFGRGAYFLIVDPDTFEWTAASNPAHGAGGGAGVQASQFVVQQKCQAVVSGDFGPNAYQALKSAGISMYLLGTCRTVREAVQRFKSGQMEPVSDPQGARRR